MKILFLLPYDPSTPSFGGALRIFHILKYLATHHDVTVIGFSTPEQEKDLIEQIPQLKGKTRLVSPPEMNNWRFFNLLRSVFSFHSSWYLATRSSQYQNIIYEVLSETDFDVIHSEFPPMAMYDFPGKALKVINCHNVEYDNFKRMAKAKSLLRKVFYLIQAIKFEKEEISICSKQNGLLVTSERDMELFKKSIPDIPQFLIPNGVDPEYFSPANIDPVPHSLVFVGMMKYLPNSDGIEYFLDNIFPLVQEKYPDTTITIVGKNAPESLSNRATDNIIFTGFVDDVRPYIHNASVYVVPLRMGGGTRLKVLEALAMKKPMVSTSIGCEGIDVVHGDSILIADDPQEFASNIIELFQNDDLKQKITENGYKLIMEKYQWWSICKNIDHAYSDFQMNTQKKELAV